MYVGIGGRTADTSFSVQSIVREFDKMPTAGLAKNADQRQLIGDLKQPKRRVGTGAASRMKFQRAS